MQFNEYQKLASRTVPTYGSGEKTGLLTNFCLGLAGETGETIDYLKKVIFHGHSLDKDKLEYELGDILWYVSQIAQLVNIPLETIAIENIEKLKRRYPQGFNSDDSIKRSE
jgi:NTP pyrophosphatase (non-canonical NTP hydrolase)